MWHAMFVEQIPLAEKILRTVLVYALIAVLFRVVGKRGLANLNTFDFVVMFLLSNVVQNAVIGNDTSLTGGVVGAVTLVTVNAVVNRVIASNATAARVFDGNPTTVISGGHVVNRALHHLGLRRSELDHAVRLQNGDDIAQVQSGSLEPGGQLVLTLKHSEQGATKADIAEVTARLSRIETLLGGDQVSRPWLRWQGRGRAEPRGSGAGAPEDLVDRLDALVALALEPENAVLTDDTRAVRWAGPLFALFALVMVPWTVYIGESLPRRQLSPHYDASWAGFDVMLLAALAATAFFALRRSRYLSMAATATAVLLVVDAWFDLMTTPSGQLAQSIVLAAVVELPLAAVCTWLSLHTQELTERRIVLLMRRRGLPGRADRRP